MLNLPRVCMYCSLFEDNCLPNQKVGKIKMWILLTPKPKSRKKPGERMLWGTDCGCL